MASEACNTYSVANVPFYDTLGAEAVAFICAQSGLSTVFTGRAETGKLVKMKATNATELKEVKNVIQFDDVTDEERAAAQKAGITLRSFVEVSDIGRANPKPHQPPKPKDLAFICYTSGEGRLSYGEKPSAIKPASRSTLSLLVFFPSAPLMQAPLVCPRAQ